MRNRSATSRREGRVEFLGEQDGPAERELKTLLEVELKRFSSVHRAYLARVGFAPNAEISIALCIAPSAANRKEIVEVVHRTFSSLFETAAHLDILFPNEEQEIDLLRVCRSFL